MVSIHLSEASQRECDKEMGGEGDSQNVKNNLEGFFSEQVGNP